MNLWISSDLPAKVVAKTSTETSQIFISSDSDLTADSCTGTCTVVQCLPNLLVGIEWHVRHRPLIANGGISMRTFTPGLFCLVSPDTFDNVLVMIERELPGSNTAAHVCLLLCFWCFFSCHRFNCEPRMLLSEHTVTQTPKRKRTAVLEWKRASSCTRRNHTFRVDLIWFIHFYSAVFMHLGISNALYIDHT